MKERVRDEYYWATTLKYFDVLLTVHLSILI